MGRLIMQNNNLKINEEYKYGFKDPEKYFFKSEKGLSKKLVEQISYMKEECSWMREFRLNALDIFLSKPMPWWGNEQKLALINFDDLYYYIKPSERQSQTWEEVPDAIKNTFDKLGIPEAERKFLAGVSAQYESEVVYHNMKKSLQDKGVIFLDMDSALKNYPDLVREYFGSIIPPTDNKFASLNSAVWSGGSFIYVPKGVRVDIPLQAYFRINAKNMGQFERTLIIADEGSFVHYIEGCTAPIYTTSSLHAAVVELIAKKDAYIRYTTIQNWSKNVFNLVTKRSIVYENARVEWVDGNLGSSLTMKYPSIILAGAHASGEVLSIAFASRDQHQDAGSKVIHVAPYTSSVITSKSISKDGGRTSYRGLVNVAKGAKHAKTFVRCDALILDSKSRSDTYPTMEVNEESANVSHEATVSKLADEQLFYIKSRGIKENEAMMLIINGFIEPFTKQLPLEYAIELNSLIEMEMEGAVG
jgi:Fe-S cluster assembly protein SufB